MLASRSARVIAAALAAPFLSACDYDCGTISQTVANGVVRDAAGATLATAQAELRQTVGPSLLFLSVGVMAPAGSAGAPLRGHVTRARLVTASGDVLAEVPTGTPTLYVDGVVALNIYLESDDEYGRIRTALLTGGAKLILETDLAGREHIETPLPDAHDLPSDVRRCRPA